jgi:restriction endonuclease S subunit
VALTNVAGVGMNAGLGRRLSRAEITRHFLVAYLMLPVVRDWIGRRVSATAMATLSMRLLAKLPIVVPPRSTQTAVGEVLSALDEKIRVHTEISRATAELRDALAPLLMTGAATRAPA